MTRVAGNQSYTIDELLAVFIAREIQDGEHIFVGRNLFIPMAGALLANMHHGPNIKVGFGHSVTNLCHEPLVEVNEMNWQKELRWAESFRPEDRTMISLKRLSRAIFFIGGIQIDKYGNSNMIGIGKNHQKLEFRGPGAIGTASLTTYVGRYYIFLNNHNKRVLVDRCDYVSCVGWRTEKISRADLGVPGPGPRYCLTPLGIMDFEENTKLMRIKSIHPGISIEDVKKNTGFDLIVPESVEITPEPDGEELRILRTRIDPKGYLRQ